jgi:hypothetical protein
LFELEDLSSADVGINASVPISQFDKAESPKGSSE